jgi:hypothetical protein
MFSLWRQRLTRTTRKVATQILMSSLFQGLGDMLWRLRKTSEKEEKWWVWLDFIHYSITFIERVSWAKWCARELGLNGGSRGPQSLPCQPYIPGQKVISSLVHPSSLGIPKGAAPDPEAKWLWDKTANSLLETSRTVWLSIISRG